MPSQSSPSQTILQSMGAIRLPSKYNPKNMMPTWARTALNTLRLWN